MNARQFKEQLRILLFLFLAAVGVMAVITGSIYAIGNVTDDEMVCVKAHETYFPESHDNDYADKVTICDEKRPRG